MGAFARKGFPSPTILVTNLHRPKATFLVAPAILAAAGLLFGLAPGRLDDTWTTTPRLCPPPVPPTATTR